MPTWLTRTFVGVVVLGGTTLLWSLGDGRAGNIMFDGASACEYSVTMFSTSADSLSMLVLYATAIWVYLSSAVPGMFLFSLYHHSLITAIRANRTLWTYAHSVISSDTRGQIPGSPSRADFGTRIGTYHRLPRTHWSTNSPSWSVVGRAKGR